MTAGRSELSIAARCAGWKPIDFAVEGDKKAGELHGDTVRTIKQVQVHNQTGLNKRCPKFKRVAK